MPDSKLRLRPIARSRTGTSATSIRTGKRVTPPSRCFSRRPVSRTPTVGLLTNIICCPGGDFCSLANAKSIRVAEAIQQRFDDLDYLHDIGEVDLNISGCMNACGHHHVGHIGILGVDKSGEEWYQITIGGAAGKDASLGEVIGPSVAKLDVPETIARLLEVYVERRQPDERVLDVVRRLRDRES